MSAVVETRPQGKPIGAWYNGAAVVGGLLALFAIFLVPTIEPALLRAEHWAADWRTAWLSGRMPSSHPKVAIIRITEESVADFPYFLPVNRGYFADIIDAVDKAGARAIGLDFCFTRDTEKQFDDKLRETLRRLKDKLVVGAVEKRVTAAAAQVPVRLHRRHAGRIHRSPPRDGSRGPLPRLSQERRPLPGEPLLSPGQGRRLEGHRASRPHRLAAAADRRRRHLPYNQGPQPRKAKLEQNPTLLKDRIVLIGGDLYTLDLHWTPLSIRSRAQTVGVEVHAQMLAELIDRDRSYRELDPPVRTGFLLVLAALGIWLGLRFQERRFDFLDWRVVSFGVIAVDLASFKFLFLVLPFTHAALAWGAAVTAGTHLPRATAWVRGRRKPA